RYPAYLLSFPTRRSSDLRRFKQFMKNTLRVAGAYIGAIIGAGYASGQEILQFFGSYGWIGIVGSIITVGIYPILGYYIVLLGEKDRKSTRLNSSHVSISY